MLSASLAEVLPRGSVVTEVVPRTGGELSTVYEVRLSGADPLIVKQYPDEWRWKQAKEVYVYRLLAEHGVARVPRVVHVDEERAMTVLTVVPGGPLSEVRPDPEVMSAGYREMGRFLAELHRIPMPAYGYLTTTVLDPLPDNTSYLTRQFTKKLTEFAALGGPAAVGDTVRAAVAAGAHLFAACPSAVLCHNDLHEGNVLVDGAGVVRGFVDMENMIAADPLMDLAKTIQYDLTADPAKYAALVDGYGPLPAGAADRLRLYRLYHALELWDWFASIGSTEPLPSILESVVDLSWGIR